MDEFGFFFFPSVALRFSEQFIVDINRSPHAYKDASQVCMRQCLAQLDEIFSGQLLDQALQLQL